MNNGSSGSGDVIVCLKSLARHHHGTSGVMAIGVIGNTGSLKGLLRVRISYRLLSGVYLSVRKINRDSEGIAGYAPPLRTCESTLPLSIVYLRVQMKKKSHIQDNRTTFARGVNSVGVEELSPHKPGTKEHRMFSLGRVAGNEYARRRAQARYEEL